MNTKLKAWTVIITIGMSIFLTPHVQAGTSNTIFADWQGNFINRAFVNERPEMDTVYQKISVEAQKRGETYTVAQIKNIFKKMAHTEFHKMSIAGDEITFYDKEKKMPHRYKALGTVPDTYGNHKFEWYAFEAAGKGSETSRYRYIIMLKIHQHKNSQPHFHIRYGNKGIKELTGLGGMKNWWPSMVKPNFDITTYINNVNPKIMAKVLPGCNTK